MAISPVIEYQKPRQEVLQELRCLLVMALCCFHVPCGLCAVRSMHGNRNAE